ncbi:ABC transporter ATP-binding protein [Arthrobacter sp. TMP15]|uniref:ABC transporter ATP-binding protein n=1 Tax=Arthrobacter sp. TMP15 TaxID=3140789 RepID=UPI0031BB5D19
MASIEMAQLSHHYSNGHVGLDSIDLHIADGEFLALLGPSGSGKTTLLRTIAGFLRPTSGTLEIGGKSVAGPKSWIPPERRGLGMVFQDHAVWPHLNVASNVGYPLKRAGVPRPEINKKVTAVLEQVGLAELAKRKPSALSGGQRQRVALARAIVAQPQALLLDEALSALDEPLRARLRLELRSLTRDAGLTAIHVTHDRSEALGLADRIVVLNDGKIQQIGSAAQLLEEPANAFVASFVSDSAVFPGTLVNGRFHADHPELRLPARTETMTGKGTRMVGTLTTAWARARRVVAAVPPTGIELEPVPAGETTGARVTSALYGQHGYETSLDWAGTSVRVLVRGWIPAVGDLVRPVVFHAHVFSNESAPCLATESAA